MTISVHSTGASTAAAGTIAGAQKAQDSGKSASIFGDRNGNNIVDRDDFDNEEDYKMFEEKGLLGQIWDKAMEFIDSLKGNPPEGQEKTDDVPAQDKSGAGAQEPGNQEPDYSELQGVYEVHDLKDISQMTIDEVKQELDEYGIAYDEKTGDRRLRTMLTVAREQRAQHDDCSDEVDGHIGTFVQGENRYCTILARLDSITDEQMAEMVQERTTEDGKKVYTITFPIDNGTDNTVEVTEDEIRAGQITVMENGQERVLTDFPTGDMDVTMMTMAYVKRFGTSVTDGGAWVFQTNNNFRTQSEEALHDNQYLEDMDVETLLQHQSIGLLVSEEVARKGIEVHPLSNEDISWISDPRDHFNASVSSGLVMTLSDGRKACVCDRGIFLSDGTRIAGTHAMIIRGYDESTQELIISASEYNNQSETRVPIELIRFFETASTADTAGVARTPEPEV